MSQVNQRGIQAKRLLDDETFQSVLSEIRDEAKGVFFNANSAISDIAVAHEKVRAVQYILDTIAARVNAMEIETKRLDRHRAND